MPERNRREIHGRVVNGVDLDAQTRCAHWHSPLDVIAIRFACCGEFYSCYECHVAMADHDAKQWRAGSSKQVILCGVCGTLLSIDDYRNSDSRCPDCSSIFNPACKKHYHLYFE